MITADKPSPAELKQLDASHLGILWKDGHDSTYSVRNLRLECPCAHCVDEWTREKILKVDSVPQEVKPIRIQPVGRYAFRIDWSDRHDTGIYPFELLRRLCECGQCRKA